MNIQQPPVQEIDLGTGGQIEIDTSGDVRAAQDRTTTEAGKKTRDVRNSKTDLTIRKIPEDSPEEPEMDQMSVTSKGSMELLETSCREDTIQEVLGILKIKHFTTQSSSNGRYILTTFCLPSNQVEIALICLQQHGIGNNNFTSVSVVPSSIHLRGEALLSGLPDILDKGGRPSSESIKKGEEAEKLENKIEKFYSSIKSRMLVAEVVARIRAGGEFTFDYLMLLFLAGCIAFMGLLENSTVVLVASMLVSPLMGPILAGIFGSVIQDKELRTQGIWHELASLLFCITLGFIWGLIFCPWIEAYGVEQWPTPEMLGRGYLRALYVGVLIAVPSGAGVALSVLGGNAGSLVGVAISASLLPPAVNCGLFWAMALISIITDREYLIGYVHDTDPLAANSTLPLYTSSYSDDLAVEAVILGLVSFSLTLVNILCIIVTGVLILKVKEVTPDKIPQNFSSFWKNDVKIHRDYYHTLKKKQEISLAEHLFQEAREALGIGRSHNDAIEGTFLHGMFEKAQEENDKINIKDWVSLPVAQAPATPDFRRVGRSISYMDSGMGIDNEYFNQYWRQMSEGKDTQRERRRRMHNPVFTSPTQSLNPESFEVIIEEASKDQKASQGNSPFHV